MKSLIDRLERRYPMSYSYDRSKTAKTTLSQTNVALMASQYAARAFSKGERHGGSANNTTYPKKWYSDLERMFGVLDARTLAAFDILYDWQMWQLTNERQDTRGWPSAAVRLMTQAGLPKQ